MEKEKTKRNIKIAVLVSAAVIIVISVIGMYPRYHLKNLANEAFAAFQKDALPDYLDYLREESGISDLKASVSIVQDEEYYTLYYDEDTKTLSLTYRLTQFYSDVIDEEYTTEYKSSNADSLYKHLRDLAVSQVYLTGDSAVLSKYRYTNGRGETVNLELYDYESAPSIRLVSGQENVYTYYFSGSSVEVEVNDELVYYRKAGSTRSSSGTTSGRSGSSGSGSSSSGSSSRSNNSSGSGADGTDASPGKTVDGYDDPDDYATDYESDYDDYDDAYDAWEDDEGE